MLTVSEQELGTTEQVWLQAPALHGLAPFVLPPAGRLVVVAPHPDDEILGAAGLMLAAHHRGADITVVAVTDGEASHPGTDWNGARLAARRRTESRDALERLGIDGVRIIRCALPDGAVADHERLLAHRLVDIVDRDTCLAATWRHDGHPDHEATGRAAAAAAAATAATLYEHPIWAWHWATPSSGIPLQRARRLDLAAPDHRAKVRAVAAFTSQIEPLGSPPAARTILPPPIRARFERSFEVHLQEAPA